MVVPRNRFSKRVTRDEAFSMVEVVVDAWRTWIGLDNGLLKTGHVGCCRWWGRRGNREGRSRRRTCGW